MGSLYGATGSGETLFSRNSSRMSSTSDVYALLKDATLVHDPERNGHCLMKAWTKIYNLLGLSEFHQRELVLLDIMREQLCTALCD